MPVAALIRSHVYGLQPLQKKIEPTTEEYHNPKNNSSSCTGNYIKQLQAYERCFTTVLKSQKLAQLVPSPRDKCRNDGKRRGGEEEDHRVLPYSAA